MQQFLNARLADGTLADLSVSNGRFSAITSAGDGTRAASAVDLDGWLVVPAFVEGHVHLDTSFYGDAWRPHMPCANGFDVRERVAFQARNLVAAAPMAERARNQLELCLGNGSLSMRSHVMVSADVGLKHVECILAVREEYRDWIDIQLVAFPQSGILSSPGTSELMDEALKMGCDLVGGLDPASFDGDVKGHLDAVFGLAEKHGAGIDIHLHDGGSLGLFEIGEIVARTKASGMPGKVAVSRWVPTRAVVTCSGPVSSTTSISTGSDMSAPLPGPRRSASGLIPTMTWAPLRAAFAYRAGNASRASVLAIASLPSSTVASSMFIAGAPTKPAT